MGTPDKPLPYYKWMWQDWRSNRTVQRMSYIERGLYRELLDECWVEGSIPDSMELLAEICGCPVDVMTNAWQMLGKCFKHSDGCYTNEKLDSLRTERDAIRAKRVMAGKKGGICKALNNNENLANAKQVPAIASDCHIEEKEKRREEKNTSPSDLSPAKADNVPVQEVADAYNAICGDLFPQVLKLTDKRRKAIRARWLSDTKNPDERKRTDSLGYWQRYFGFCRTGVEFFKQAASGEHKGNHAGWRPDFDFLMRESTWLGVKEGKYQ